VALDGWAVVSAAGMAAARANREDMWGAPGGIDGEASKGSIRGHGESLVYSGIMRERFTEAIFLEIFSEFFRYR
jgi:hypothetical protein